MVMVSPFARSMPGVLAWMAATGGPFVLYALSLPHDVVLEDDGLFLMAGQHLGIAHPPGYPLHTWVCHAFMQLPFGTPALLGHLSSAVLGALACGFVFWGARLLGASTLPAVMAAWLFGASECFWSQAVITEVYALNALLFFAVYTLALHAVRSPERIWPWLTAAAVYGLSMANHWPLMALATPGLLAAALPARRRILKRLPMLLGIALPCAVLPYAWLVWRSQQAPLFSFYGAIDNWDRFWFYLSRQGYASVDASASAGWADRFAYLQWFGHEIVWQLTLPGFVLGLLGLLVLLRRRQLAAAASGLLVFAGNGFALILLLNFDFDPFWTAVFRPYPLVCFGVLAMWLAVGVQFLMERCPSRLAGMRFPSRWPASGLAALAGLLMVGSSVQAHWETNGRAESDFAEHFAAYMLDGLPPNAVLFAFSDIETGTLGYHHFVAQRRPDVQLLSLSGLAYGNRLFDPLLPTSERRDVLEAFIDASEHPVFLPMNFDADLFPRERKGRLSGFLMRIFAASGKDNMELTRDPAGEKYFLHLMDAQYADLWERAGRNGLLHQYCRYLGYVRLTDNPIMLEPMQPLYGHVGRNYHCITGITSVLLEHGEAHHWDLAGQWLPQLETLKHEALFKKEMAARFYLNGLLAERRGREKAAMHLYRKSRAVNPHPDNDAFKAIARLRNVKAKPARPSHFLNFSPLQP